VVVDGCVVGCSIFASLLEDKCKFETASGRSCITLDKYYDESISTC
jgi:hypothetical protein